MNTIELSTIMERVNVNAAKHQKEDCAAGNGVVVVNLGPNAKCRFYVADRPGFTSRMRAAEIALDISITLARPVRSVWPIFKDFNRWMNRFGYFWDGVPADHEDGYVYLGNKPGVNDLKYALDDSRVKYVIRQVVPERLIYFDSLPLPLVGKDGVWSGHNVMSLGEDGGQTKIAIFMEHTWYSETMSIEELRAEGKEVLDAGLVFWRDYFVEDLVSAVEASAGSEA